MTNRIISTIGYGKLAGSHIERQYAFMERLKKAFPDGAEIIDIRKEGCGSINGKAFYQGDTMASTCIGGGCSYYAMPGLHNPYGGSQKGLSRYAREVDFNGSKNEHIEGICFFLIAGLEKRYCLLCGCGKVDRLVPYYGETKRIWNCHRGPAAAQVTAQMWYRHEEKWTVKHL